MARSPEGSRAQPRRIRRRRWPRRLVAGLVGLVVAVGLVLGSALLFSPGVSDAPQRVQALLAAHHAPSDEGTIPTKVGQALLATEDSRFYHDPALDPRGVGRALWGVVTSNSGAGGATIEQQLAKLLYTPGRSGLPAEVEQVGLAIKLDQHYSKNEILAMYLDAAYFGDGAYGITQAAQHYFGLPAEQLSWGQASLLAGLVQAPTAYDPVGHLTLALQRRSHVLDRLVATGELSAAQATAVGAAPLDPVVTFGD